MEDRKGKWSPEAGGAEAVKIYLALPCYINMRIREGVKKKQEKSGQADRLGRPPLPRPRVCQKTILFPFFFVAPLPNPHIDITW